MTGEGGFFWALQTVFGVALLGVAIWWASRRMRNRRGDTTVATGTPHPRDPASSTPALMRIAIPVILGMVLIGVIFTVLVPSW